LATRWAALFLVVLLAVGCGEGEGNITDPPAELRTLHGRVFDAMELPVEGARINLIYELEGYPLTLPVAADDPEPTTVDSLYLNHPNPFSPTTEIRFSLEYSQILHVVVLGAEGDTLRTLFHGVWNTGVHSVRWDGRDDAGELQPNGVYRVRITYHANMDGPSDEIGGVFFLTSDPAILAGSALVETDAEGRFSIPLASLPIGEMIPATNEEGVLMGIFPVSSNVQVHAAIDATTWDRHSLDFGSGETDIEVELHLP